MCQQILSKAAAFAASLVACFDSHCRVNSDVMLPNSLNYKKNLVAVKTSNSLLAVLFCFSLAHCCHAQQTLIDGEWEGALVREGSEAKISINFKATTSGIEGTMTMPTVGMFRQPLSKIAFSSPRAHFEQENLAAIF
jgi:hypothetical protein